MDWGLFAFAQKETEGQALPGMGGFAADQLVLFWWESLSLFQAFCWDSMPRR